MLSSTVFDGMHETQVWWNVLYQSDFQLQFYAAQEFILLIASPCIFLALYAGTIYAMSVLANVRQKFFELLLRFAYSLIPIAIAYSFAHYFTLVVYQTQTLVPLLSDPLSYGWNLFATAARGAGVAIIGAQEVWYTQFGVILAGHIVATYVAHRIALREFDTRKKVIVGQLPILILMVFYTVFGLWILSQAYQSP